MPFRVNELQVRVGRALGRVDLALEDFELEMHSGTLFTSPPELGPTALTFIGEATVRFKPRPDAEPAGLVDPRL